MINVKELRIGNHILADFGKVDGVKQIEVFQINESGIVYDEHSNEHCDVFLQPISLTEDWLLKFGFIKKQGEINENIDFSLNGFYIQQHLECNDFICLNTDYYISVKYLHQLQNLFYCLSGKELTLKD